MGSGSEKGESIATDPGFAMYHQLSLLTGSLPLDRAARQKRSSPFHSDAGELLSPFRRFYFPSEESMDNTTLLIVIIVVILLLGGGGWYGRGRWF